MTRRLTSSPRDKANAKSKMESLQSRPMTSWTGLARIGNAHKRKPTSCRRSWANLARSNHHRQRSFPPQPPHPRSLSKSQSPSHLRNLRQSHQRSHRRKVGLGNLASPFSPERRRARTSSAQRKSQRSHLLLRESRRRLELVQASSRRRFPIPSLARDIGQWRRP